MPRLRHLTSWSYLLAIVITLAALFFAAPATVRAETCTSNGTGGGDWTAAATWVQPACNGIPNATDDDVIIVAGDIVNLGPTAAANRQVQNLTINGTLNHTNGVPDLRVTNDITVNAGGAFNGGAGTRVVFNSGAAGAKSIAGAGTIQLAGVFVQVGGLNVAAGSNVLVSENLDFSGGNLAANAASTFTFTDPNITNASSEVDTRLCKK